MRKVNSIDDIVRIKEDHRIEDLVYRTSNHPKKMRWIRKKKNSTLSSLSINLYRTRRLIVSDRHICCKDENNSFSSISFNEILSNKVFKRSSTSFDLEQNQNYSQILFLEILFYLIFWLIFSMVNCKVRWIEISLKIRFFK